MGGLCMLLASHFVEDYFSLNVHFLAVSASTLIFVILVLLLRLIACGWTQACASADTPMSVTQVQPQ
jgi:hypothetical protein